ncbi:hypothetical protein BGZ60DRAFT_522830 [Tricladium varicosporioides]|nr:hypothetical protein BGZ60DRAFT_522830 [Hymenoscyphus varicosporioides]
MSKEEKLAEDAKGTTINYVIDWGKSPLPPMLLATFVTALHARPFQPLPMLFPPVFLFSTYLNLSEFKTDSAGITAAWSGLYLLLANRRRVSGNGMRARLGSRFNVRGMTRGAAMGLAGINLIGCGAAYGFGKREKREESP